MPDIMETIDEREKENKNKNKNKERKKQMGGASFSESVRAKWFCCAFKLGFVQLICKASLIFKSSLELALSIILKERELYESNDVVVECRCLKMCNLLPFLICFYVYENLFFVFSMASCSSGFSVEVIKPRFKGCF